LAEKAEGYGFPGSFSISDDQLEAVSIKGTDLFHVVHAAMVASGGQEVEPDSSFGGTHRPRRRRQKKYRHPR
jgi:hypothetical protein